MSGVFRNFDPPPPHRPASVYLPAFGAGGGHTRWVERRWGVKSSEDARLCSVLYKCKYFVCCPHRATIERRGRTCHCQTLDQNRNILRLTHRLGHTPLTTPGALQRQRVLAHSKRSEGRQKSFERGKCHPHPHWVGKQYSQTRSNLCQAALLRRCKLSLYSKFKC